MFNVTDHKVPGDCRAYCYEVRRSPYLVSVDYDPTKGNCVTVSLSIEDGETYRRLESQEVGASSVAKYNDIFDAYLDRATPASLDDLQGCDVHGTEMDQACACMPNT